MRNSPPLAVRRTRFCPFVVCHCALRTVVLGHSSCFRRFGGVRGRARRRRGSRIATHAALLEKTHAYMPCASPGMLPAIRCCSGWKAAPCAMLHHLAMVLLALFFSSRVRSPSPKTPQSAFRLGPFLQPQNDQGQKRNSESFFKPSSACC